MDSAFGVSIFHEYFAYYFGEKESRSLGIQVQIAKSGIPEFAVAVRKEFKIAECNFVTKNARHKIKEVVNGIEIRIAFFPSVFFLLEELFLSLLNRKSNKYFYQSLNLLFQYP